MRQLTMHRGLLVAAAVTTAATLSGAARLIRPSAIEVDAGTAMRLVAIPRTVGIALGAIVVLRLAAGSNRLVRSWSRLGAWIGFATYLGWQFAVLCILPEGNDDFAVFLRAGREAAAGQDPYSYAGADVFLNPLPALGVFRIAAQIPAVVLGTLWTMITAVLAAALVPLANRILIEGKQTDDPAAPGSLPGDIASLLSAAILNSNASIWGHRLGQLSVLMALALMLAVWARQRGRPALAGLALAVAACKPATLLPFLVLFLRKRDRAAWISMTAVLLGLSLVAAPPARWPGLLQSNLRQIKASSEPGKVNDYGFEQGISSDIIAFDHLFYRLGMRDRELIAHAHLAAVAGLLAVCVAVARRGSPAATASIVAVGAMLVLYHRTYDSVLLALPLACGASIALSSSGSRRLTAVASVALLLAVVDQPRSALSGLTRWTLGHGAVGWLVQAVVLPYATWSILASLVCLASLLVPRRERAEEAAQVAPYSLSLR